MDSIKQLLIALASFNFICSMLTFQLLNLDPQKYRKEVQLDLFLLLLLAYSHNALDFIMLNKIYNFVQLMNNLASPFIASIKECKQSMRKLRKKIYKHSISTKTKGKRPRDDTQKILTIFRQREIPEFVTNALLKRRTFDLSSIKNIAITVRLSLLDIRNRTNKQEIQASKLYEYHRERMTEIKSKAVQLKTEKSLALGMHLPGIYSSTEEQVVFSSASNLEENNSLVEKEQEGYENFSSESKEQGFPDNYFQLNNAESSLNSELALFNF